MPPARSHAGANRKSRTKDMGFSHSKPNTSMSSLTFTRRTWPPGSQKSSSLPILWRQRRIPSRPVSTRTWDNLLAATLVLMFHLCNSFPERLHGCSSLTQPEGAEVKRRLMNWSFTCNQLRSSMSFIQWDTHTYIYACTFHVQVKEASAMLLALLFWWKQQEEKKCRNPSSRVGKFDWNLQFQELGNNTLPVNVSPAVIVHTCCALVASVWICPWTTWVPDTGWAKRIYCSWPAFNWTWRQAEGAGKEN